MTCRMTQNLENDECKISIGGREFCCSVNAEVEINYTQEVSAQNMGGRMEDAVPASPAEAEVTAALCDVEIYDDDGDEIGKLKLKGVEWFDAWFEPDEIEFEDAT